MYNKGRKYSSSGANNPPANRENRKAHGFGVHPIRVSAARFDRLEAYTLVLLMHGEVYFASLNGCFLTTVGEVRYWCKFRFMSHDRPPDRLPLQASHNEHKLYIPAHLPAKMLPARRSNNTFSWNVLASKPPSICLSYSTNLQTCRALLSRQSLLVRCI